jgi:molecular chaperone IbpA
LGWQLITRLIGELKMTLLLKNGPFDMFKDMDKFLVGFDDTYNRMAKFHDDLTKNIPNYPPYNIRKVEDNKYVIELAVAGFAKQDIDITFEDNKLIISGKTQDTTDDNFIFKGIANRVFTRTFLLDEHIEIKDAGMMNGMLKIALEKIIPEHKKPKKIEVKDGDAKVSKKQLLTERNVDNEPNI